MSQEDRDWFREKRIDYDKGGLIRRGSNANSSWLVKIIIVVGVIALIALGYALIDFFA